MCVIKSKNRNAQSLFVVNGRSLFEVVEKPRNIHLDLYRQRKRLHCYHLQAADLG
eukprot:m.53874 g.53874  ORF g.53874 m.53874 type:complete len:55 (-) comp9170_c0_seq2:1433-1597(-)